MPWCLRRLLSWGGPSRLFGFETLLITLAFVALFMVALAKSNGGLFVQTEIFALLSLLYIFPRLLMYLTNPAQVVFPIDIDLDGRAIDRAMVWILAGAGLMLLGFVLAEVQFGKVCAKWKARPQKEAPPDLTALVGVTTFVLAIEIIISFVFGVSPYVDAPDRVKEASPIWHLFAQGFRVAFSFEMALLAVVGWALSGDIKKKPALLLVSTAVLVYLAITVFSGSRSGLLRVAMIAAVSAMVAHGNFRFRVSRLIIAVVLMFSVSVPGYLVATKYRMDVWKSSVSEASDAKEIRARDMEANVEHLKSPKVLLAIIANRLGVIDYAIIVLNREGAKEATARYMNLSYISKNIVNLLLPGEPFPEASLNTSRVFTIVYRGDRESSLRSRDYFSEFWTGWGVAYVLFGTVGGLAALFFVAFFLHEGLCLIRLSSVRHKARFESCYTLVAPPMVYLSMGVDHSIVTFIFMMAQMAIFLWMLDFVSVLRRKVAGETLTGLENADSPVR